MAEEKVNAMSKPRLEKVTINMGIGEPGERLDNAEELLRKLTNKKPVRTKAKKRIPTFGIRPGLPIGVKVTLRGKEGEELVKRLLSVKRGKLKARNYDNSGNVSFGIEEYIDVPGMKYDPNIGMFGFDVALTIKKPGVRVSRRKMRRARVGKNQRVSKDEAIAFMKETFSVETEE
ncbi:MAG: 50S ribosomal protein L5 [Methanobacteriota archaeon]|nr:MAG: 50S ribosomal protein L5 [Euryarchaeota archaeon]